MVRTCGERRQMSRSTLMFCRITEVSLKGGIFEGYSVQVFTRISFENSSTQEQTRAGKMFAC